MHIVNIFLINTFFAEFNEILTIYIFVKFIYAVVDASRHSQSQEAPALNGLHRFAKAAFFAQNHSRVQLYTDKSVFPLQSANSLLRTTHFSSGE
jgi:hypothetical protein